jgi:hypothetical protein
MPTLRRILAALAIGGALALASPPPAAAEVSVSVTFFYDHLAPYGRWVASGSYGRCWAPAHVAVGWAPYVDGEWVWTDYGWTWISSDPWGDVVYHYGTWVWVDPYGWVWVPGTIWAPAWVTWAYTDDYVGWAPVPPSFVLSASGYAGGAVVVPAARYVFVPSTQFVGVNVASVRVPAPRTATLLARSTRVTRYTVSGGIVHTAGPPSGRIERATGRRIERVGIDRIHSRPTTLAAAGVTQSRSLRVVAPARERDRAIASRSAAGGSAHAAPPSSERPAHHARMTPKTPERRAAPGRASTQAAAPPEHGRAAHEPASSAQGQRHAAPPQPATAERVAPRGHAEAGPPSHGHTASVAPRPEHRPEQPSAQAAPAKPAPPAKPAAPPGQEKKAPHGNSGKDRDK